MDKNKVLNGKKIRRSETAFDPVSAALQQLHQAIQSEKLPEDFLKILSDIDAKIAAVRISTSK